jgi:hypothetical protein
MVVVMVEKSKEKKTTTPTTPREPREFREIIEPLELAAGSRLRGKSRRLVRSAFYENVEGLRQIAAECLADGDNPLGLLVFKVKDDHHLDDLPALEARGDRPRAVGSARPPCPTCRIGGGRHLADCERALRSRNGREAA